MNPLEIGKFVEELFRWEPHRIGALVTGLFLGFSACWLLRRHSDAPLRKKISLLETQADEFKRESDRLASELANLRNEHLNQLHASLDNRIIPMRKREILAWTNAGRTIPVCMHTRGELTHRVIFPDGRDDTVKVNELSPWSSLR